MLLSPYAFRLRVSHQAQEPPLSSSRLNRGYDRAPAWRTDSSNERNRIGGGQRDLTHLRRMTLEQFDLCLVLDVDNRCLALQLNHRLTAREAQRVERPVEADARGPVSGHDPQSHVRPISDLQQSSQ